MSRRPHPLATQFGYMVLIHCDDGVSRFALSGTGSGYALFARRDQARRFRRELVEAGVESLAHLQILKVRVEIGLA